MYFSAMKTDERTAAKDAVLTAPHQIEVDGCGDVQLRSQPSPTDPQPDPAADEAVFHPATHGLPEPLSARADKRYETAGG